MVIRRRRLPLVLLGKGTGFLLLGGVIVDDEAVLLPRAVLCVVGLSVGAMLSVNLRFWLKPLVPIIVVPE